MGLLITKYVFNLVQISSENYKYYKAYYIADAGIELELWKLKNHWMWFQDIITRNSTTVVSNFSWINYNFSVETTALSHYISSNPKSLIEWNSYCSNKSNWIKLWTWEGLLIPLIYDKTFWETLYSGKNIQILPLSFSNIILHYSWDIVLGYISNNFKKTYNIWAWNNTFSLDTKFTFPYPSDIWETPFIVIWTTFVSSICLDNYDNKIVSPYSYISSKWNYMDGTVALKVIKHHNWANFSIYGLY